ncbi:MAG: N-acetylmuramoyl-L-alanine amidase [Propionivibrio sp.]
MLAQACDRSDFVIAVDAGHSHASPGATSARGVPEVRFNRQLARSVYDTLLRAGFDKAFLTNKDQDTVSLTDRAAQANERKARVFLSIHHDSVQQRYLSTWYFEGKQRLYSDLFSGYSLFVSARNVDYKGSVRLAELLGSEFRRRCLIPTLHHAENTPGENRELVDQLRGIYRFDDLVVLRSTNMPAVLIEAGVIVNRRAELVLRSPVYRETLATAITTAVKQFCDDKQADPVAEQRCREPHESGMSVQRGP